MVGWKERRKNGRGRRGKERGSMKEKGGEVEGEGEYRKTKRRTNTIEEKGRD